jgi:hypothetical protein
VRNQLRGDHESHSLQRRWLASTGQPASIYSARDAGGAVIDVAKRPPAPGFISRLSGCRRLTRGLPIRTGQHKSKRRLTSAGTRNAGPSMELRAISEAIAFYSRLV